MALSSIMPFLAMFGRSEVSRFTVSVIDVEVFSFCPASGVCSSTFHFLSLPLVSGVTVDGFEAFLFEGNLGFENCLAHDVGDGLGRCEYVADDADGQQNDDSYSPPALVPWFLRAV